MNDYDTSIRFSVTPEPSEHEMAAIVTVVMATQRGRVSSGATPPNDDINRWREAARRDALREENSPL